MKPAPLIPSRPTSDRRAAAARADGAKSRGPVTVIGKANSARNSHRHGLRSWTLFADPESASQRNAILASFEHEFQPQSEIERTLIGTMALTQWRRTCLWKLETSIVNREIRRLKSLTPSEDPVTLTALAFRPLIDHGCSLEIIKRLESCCERQYERAVDRLTPLRAHGIPQNINIHERPGRSLKTQHRIPSQPIKPVRQVRLSRCHPRHLTLLIEADILAPIMNRLLLLTLACSAIASGLAVTELRP